MEIERYKSCSLCIMDGNVATPSPSCNQKVFKYLDTLMCEYCPDYVEGEPQVVESKKRMKDIPGIRISMDSMREFSCKELKVIQDLMDREKDSKMRTYYEGFYDFYFSVLQLVDHVQGDLGHES